MPSQKNPATPTSNIDEQANSGADEPRRQAPMNQTPTNPGTDFTRPRRTQQHRRRSTKNKLQAPILTKPRRKLIGSNKWRRTRSGGMENDMEDKSQLVPLEIPDNFKLNSRSKKVEPHESRVMTQHTPQSFFVCCKWRSDPNAIAIYITSKSNTHTRNSHKFD
ncbi:hypothetical protein CFP56_033015 [Quercus suber]|uniref:Uncharacterized protein n=1 Tax=Quercus suber TaxID=58331 RepID=A0AAW0JFY7_QUESU